MRFTSFEKRSHFSPQIALDENHLFPYVNLCDKNAFAFIQNWQTICFRLFSSVKHTNQLLNTQINSNVCVLFLFRFFNTSFLNWHHMLVRKSVNQKLFLILSNMMRRQLRWVCCFGKNLIDHFECVIFTVFEMKNGIQIPIKCYAPCKYNCFKSFMVLNRSWRTSTKNE